MNPVSEQFIEFALQTGVLAFGEFTTKSGRRTPYFFDAGRFDHGASLHRLAGFYAQTILANRDAGRLSFDMLFGPAYKGIALVAATAMALAERGLDVPFCFNRKEAKDHGEGGLLVGAPLAGRVLIIDDVITDGAAKRESVVLIRARGAQPAGVVIMLDRMERIGPDNNLSRDSAVQAFERSTGTPVIAIANLDQLLGFLRSGSALATPTLAHLAALEQYRKRYGA
ncbi:MAG TPA: orotate phosphoribosyltransferase [Burkholderiaceae bacterium]|nr:orotate phosphoribosyltransferase [Burkholderiaceae bacterium]